MMEKRRATLIEKVGVTNITFAGLQEMDVHVPHTELSSLQYAHTIDKGACS